MEDFFNKMPNWLRYVLAIPFGFICYLIGYYLFYFSWCWFASPDSIAVIIYNFAYVNCVGIVIFLYTMSLMLPKHQFAFSLILSIIYGALNFIGLGFYFFAESITLSLIIEIVLTTLTLVLDCIYIHKEFKIDKAIIDDKYIQLLNILKTAIGIENINDAIEKIYDFYSSQGINLPTTLRQTKKITEKQKYENLLAMFELATGDKGIDNIIKKLHDFYIEQGVFLPVEQNN